MRGVKSGAYSGDSVAKTCQFCNGLKKTLYPVTPQMKMANHYIGSLMLAHLSLLYNY